MLELFILASATSGNFIGSLEGGSSSFHLLLVKGIFNLNCCSLFLVFGKWTPFIIVNRGRFFRPCSQLGFDIQSQNSVVLRDHNIYFFDQWNPFSRPKSSGKAYPEINI